MISKGWFSFEVRLERMNVTVKNIVDTPFGKSLDTIADSLQALANNHLFTHCTGTPQTILVDYFSVKGWQVSTPAEQG